MKKSQSLRENYRKLKAISQCSGKCFQETLRQKERSQKGYSKPCGDDSGKEFYKNANF